MNIGRYIDVIYAVLAWTAVLLFIKPKRILELLPLGFLSAALLFCTDYYSQALSLFKFQNPRFPIAGIPLFHLVSAVGFGILLVNFLSHEFSKKLILILIFTVIMRLLGYIYMLVGYYSYLNNFNGYFDFIKNFTFISFFVFISDGISRRRIYAS